MRFLSRVLRASASAGVSSTLRTSTPPFLPLLAFPSASAFSVRLAESRAAISPALGLPGAAATPALPAVGGTLVGILAIGLPALAAGLSATLGGAFDGALRLAGFDFSRTCDGAFPFAPLRPAVFGAVRFFTELLEAGFGLLRFFAVRLPRTLRAACDERRAEGRALPRLRAVDF